MKILIVVAAVMLIAGIGLSDSILGVLGAATLAFAATDLMARRYEAHRPAKA